MELPQALKLPLVFKSFAPMGKRDNIISGVWVIRLLGIFFNGLVSFGESKSYMSVLLVAQLSSHKATTSNSTYTFHVSEIMTNHTKQKPNEK